MSKYKVSLASIEERDRLMERFGERLIYEEKADIYGCCIKLLTDLRYVKERWEESFHPMSAHVRSHGRLIVTNEEGGGQRVFYNPLSRTAFLINIDYYGWVKSLALSVAGDILEDNHGIYSVHGACVDIDGGGVCLIAPSGTGKTTHTYGLLRIKGVRVISDDWFFVRLMEGQAVAFASEKNFYIQADIADVWGEYQKLVEKAEFDSRGRAVVNVRWVVGKGKILPMTTLKKAILLKRDPEDKTIFNKLSSEKASSYLERVDFCNPHLLVKDERKTNLRRQFFKELFNSVEVYMVNTVAPILQSHKIIKEEILGL
ncbi:MAG: aldolase [Nitrososphaerota archaeon]|nr:aldolase [Candidatus Bathyarchaeota archaeon]MDW8023541.1 aldolase [Nitrososphaerota archaeon]